MKILVRREACCSQDDQLGPLEATYDVDEQCRLDEFLEAVEQSGFLQFSSTHTTLSCRFADREVARVFKPSHLVRRKPETLVDAATLVRDISMQGTVKFIFVRAPQALGFNAVHSQRLAFDSTARRAFRMSTYVLLPLSSVLSVMALCVGLVFGFNLWRWDRLGVTVAWLIIVLLPLAVYRVVKAPPRSLFTLAICACVLWAPIIVLFLDTALKN